MTVIVTCRQCGQEHEPSPESIRAGSWKVCDACRPRPKEQSHFPPAELLDVMRELVRDRNAALAASLDAPRMREAAHRGYEALLARRILDPAHAGDLVIAAAWCQLATGLFSAETPEKGA